MAWGLSHRLLYGIIKHRHLRLFMATTPNEISIQTGPPLFQRCPTKSDGVVVVTLIALGISLLLLARLGRSGH